MLNLPRIQHFGIPSSAFLPGDLRCSRAGAPGLRASRARGRPLPGACVRRARGAQAQKLLAPLRWRARVDSSGGREHATVPRRAARRRDAARACRTACHAHAHAR
jgi:hypothetical protein